MMIERVVMMMNYSNRLGCLHIQRDVIGVMMNLKRVQNENQYDTRTQQDQFSLTNKGMS